jgi:hypothetical protein
MKYSSSSTDWDANPSHSIGYVSDSMETHLLEFSYKGFHRMQSITHSSKQTSILMFRVFLGCYRKFDVDIGCERETHTQRDRRKLSLLLRRSGGKRMSEIGSLLCWESRFSPKVVISLSIKSKTHKVYQFDPKYFKKFLIIVFIFIILLHMHAH